MSQSSTALRRSVAPSNDPSISASPDPAPVTSIRKTARPIRVVTVDDHGLVRQGVKRIIDGTEDLVLTGEAACAIDALQVLRSVPCQVLLLDISLPPGRNGMEVLKLVRAEFPAIKVLMLSGYREVEYAVRALRAGASGYLNKNSAEDELVAAVRKVVSGGKYVTQKLAEELANTVGEDWDRPLHHTLSDRELETLLLIASGKSITDIATDLSLAVKTVSTFRERILRKMKMKNSSELTYYVIRNGLIE